MPFSIVEEEEKPEGGWKLSPSLAVRVLHLARLGSPAFVSADDEPGAAAAKGKISRREQKERKKRKEKRRCK